MRVLEIIEELEPKDYLVIATALLAATTSLASLFTNLFAASFAESRKSQRDMLAPIAADLGETLHQVLATSKVVITRAELGEPIENWKKKADEAAAKLKELRRKAKYPLWGTDNALGVLARLPAWVAHCRERSKQVNRLFVAADRLRSSIDVAILASLRRGKPPGFLRRAIIRYRVWRIRSIWSESEPEDQEG